MIPCFGGPLDGTSLECWTGEDGAPCAVSISDCGIQHRSFIAGQLVGMGCRVLGQYLYREERRRYEWQQWWGVPAWFARS